jgi:hypothetical protein
MRVAAAFSLSEEVRLLLEKPALGRSTPTRVVQRSRIVLLAADGLQNKQIADQIRVERWLEKHKRFHVCFAPTSASWFNTVERFFRDITKNRTLRGVSRISTN